VAFDRKNPPFAKNREGWGTLKFTSLETQREIEEHSQEWLCHIDDDNRNRGQTNESKDYDYL